jgi:NADH-quinone oxidoreductase subunit A
MLIGAPCRGVSRDEFLDCNAGDQAGAVRKRFFAVGAPVAFFESLWTAWRRKAALDRASPMNLDQYLPVILFILVGAGVGVAPQVLGFLLGPNRPDAAKNSPYECGFEAFEDARMKFDVRYYLVAILFILFDLEIAFLFPWAVSLREIGATGFWSMMIFLGILVVGFAYEWKKGALDWE